MICFAACYHVSSMNKNSFDFSCQIPECLQKWAVGGKPLYLPIPQIKVQVLS